MEYKKKIAVLIVNHLISDVEADGYNEDFKEVLGIAIQCLNSAYCLNPTEIENVDVKLEHIIKEHYPDVEHMVTPMDVC